MHPTCLWADPCVGVELEKLMLRVDPGDGVELVAVVLREVALQPAAAFRRPARRPIPSAAPVVAHRGGIAFLAVVDPRQAVGRGVRKATRGERPAPAAVAPGGAGPHWPRQVRPTRELWTTVSL